jgi:hypothetical protein
MREGTGLIGGFKVLLAHEGGQWVETGLLHGKLKKWVRELGTQA